jgi:hypothetical protein
VQTSAKERRQSPRHKSSPSQEAVSIRLEGGDHAARPLVAMITDVSDGGIGIEVPLPLKVASLVSVTGVIVAGMSRKKLDAASARVVYCNKQAGSSYWIGLAFTHVGKNSEHNRSTSALDPPESDYYDILQLSPKADPDTIHRVYRLLAQRYHPDNIETGDQTLFREVLEAYRVLSDPAERAAYDVTLTRTRQLRWKIFDQPAAALGKEAEKRKRAGVLSLLYAQRVNQPHQPAMSIPEFEDLLGCPREHLEFTLWYLREAGCLVRGDNGRFTITMKGVDAVEADQTQGLPNDRLLTAVK